MKHLNAKNGLKYLLCMQFMFFIGCGGGGGDDDIQIVTTPEVVVPVITAANLSSTINENPDVGAAIGTVQASASSGSLQYSLVSQSVNGALSVNASTGAVTVADASLFDFETIQVITAVIRVTVGSITEDVNVTVSITDVDEVEAVYTIWEGASMTFTKDDGGDPTNSSQQDHLTDNVKITRGNSGGQIYNIVSEAAAVKETSPADTEWSIGTIDQIDELTFETFRAATNGTPKNVVGQDMVLHLVTDDIYISIRFTSWSTGKAGGFAYVRSTENVDSSKK
ncbi:cadherin repeat domain-containing protein [Flavobacteriaceae bacterium]|nr:cadherin repeat domain-containing protein [Flavobacteriaceae bacterium]